MERASGSNQEGSNSCVVFMYRTITFFKDCSRHPNWPASFVDLGLSPPIWLADAVLSPIFIGRPVYKMSSEYWAGLVLYEICFADCEFWFYNIIRTCRSANVLRDVAMHHSRLVTATEFVCGFLGLILTASWLALIVFLGIALTNSVLLFSAFTSLLGLTISAPHHPKQLRSFSTETV